MKPPASFSMWASLGTSLSNRGSLRSILPKLGYLSAAEAKVLDKTNTASTADKKHDTERRRDIARASQV